jgi:hypothetical protein
LPFVAFSVRYASFSFKEAHLCGGIFRSGRPQKLERTQKYVSFEDGRDDKITRRNALQGD